MLAHVMAPRSKLLVAFVALLPLAGCGRGCRSDTAPNDASSSVAPTSVAEPSPPPPHGIARPSAAAAEFAILTAKPRQAIDKLLDVEQVVALLEPRHCGDARSCDAVKAFIRRPKAVSFEVFAKDDWKPPPREMIAEFAPTLTDAERERVYAMPWTALVRAEGKPTAAQLPARAGYALAAVLAEKLEGFVQDEMLDRVERPSTFVEHAIVAPLEATAFRRDRVGLQYGREPDGSVRLLTMGMQRFGAPDIETVGVNMPMTGPLASLLLAVQEAIITGKYEGPYTVALADVARATKLPAASLHRSPSSSVAVVIDLVPTQPHHGDPDNVEAKLVSPLGEGVAGYAKTLLRLFGDTGDGAREVKDDPAQAAATARARAAFPAILERFREESKRGAVLSVKVPFDGPGGAREFMWLEVATWDKDRIGGVLQNEPATITELHKGMTVERPRSELVDYLVTWSDGGRAGGETERN